MGQTVAHIVSTALSAFTGALTLIQIAARGLANQSSRLAPAPVFAPLTPRRRGSAALHRQR
jgi:hypothetical protein